MDALQGLDQRWTPLLFVCGLLLVVLGIAIRLLSSRRSFSWRVGDAALYLGTVFLGIAMVLHFFVPVMATFAIRSLSGN